MSIIVHLMSVGGSRVTALGDQVHVVSVGNVDDGERVFVGAEADLVSGVPLSQAIVCLISDVMTVTT